MSTPAYSAAGLLPALLAESLFVPAVGLAPASPPAVFLAIDTEYGGLHRVTGTVKEKGTPDRPVVRRVVLFRMRDRQPIRETWSAADGSYAFDWIDGAERYFVVSFDHSGNFRAVVADNLAPDPMP